MPSALPMLNAMVGVIDYHSCTLTMSVSSMSSEAELFSWYLQSAFSDLSSLCLMFYSQ